MKEALVKIQNEMEAWKEMLIVLENTHFIITDVGRNINIKGASDDGSEGNEKHVIGN